MKIYWKGEQIMWRENNYIPQIEFINRKTWNWMIKENLKKDTESTMMAVQGRSMRTRI